MTNKLSNVAYTAFKPFNQWYKELSVIHCKVIIWCRKVKLEVMDPNGINKQGKISREYIEMRLGWGV